MYTSVTEKISKRGFWYLAASAIIALAAWVYGLFSHGVHSPFMTFAFMIPLVLGAAPHIAAALSKKADKGKNIQRFTADKELCDTQLAVIATLTAGSLLKGALDIYGTTNRLMIAYPVLAATILAAAAIKKASSVSADCNEQV